MIENSKILSLEFYNYKGIFTGSLKGMRYRIEKIVEEGEEAIFWVHVWREPYNYEVTPKVEMDKKKFPFNEDGRKEIVNWLNTIFFEKYEIKPTEEE